MQVQEINIVLSAEVNPILFTGTAMNKNSTVRDLAAGNTGSVSGIAGRRSDNLISEIQL
jgi:hypothetical protein